LVRATSVNACRALANHQQVQRSAKLAPYSVPPPAPSAKKSTSSSRLGSGPSGSLPSGSLPSGQANDALSLVHWTCPYEARALAMANLVQFKARPPPSASAGAISDPTDTTTTNAATTGRAGAPGGAAGASKPRADVLAAHLQATLAPQDPRAAAAAAAQAEMAAQSAAEPLFPAGGARTKRAMSIAGGSSIYGKPPAMPTTNRV